MEEIIRVTRKYQKEMKDEIATGYLGKEPFIRIVKGLQKELKDLGIELTDNQSIHVAKGNTEIVIDKYFE